MEQTMRSFSVKHLLLVLGVVLLPLSTSMAGDPIGGYIDSYGYGYAVKVEINGTAISVIKGQGQQATRLFAVDHPMRERVPPEQQSIFVLREGDNTISVEFTKLDDGEIPLQVKLEVPGRYNTPLFHLQSVTQKHGKVSRTFTILPEMPAGFETVEVTDDSL
jgi:hypothetical protein